MQLPPFSPHKSHAWESWELDWPSFGRKIIIVSIHGEPVKWLLCSLANNKKWYKRDKKWQKEIENIPILLFIAFGQRHTQSSSSQLQQVKNRHYEVWFVWSIRRSWRKEETCSAWTGFTIRGQKWNRLENENFFFFVLDFFWVFDGLHLLATR